MTSLADQLASELGGARPERTERVRILREGIKQQRELLEKMILEVGRLEALGEPSDESQQQAERKSLDRLAAECRRVHRGITAWEDELISLESQAGKGA